jgi:predicted dehydrogenase
LANAFLNLPNVQMVAASDVFDFKMKRMQTQVNQYYANTLNKPDYNSCKGHKDFREILADKSVDAVIIASPDHWHAVMSVKACEAGKDVYCEKPLALTVAEGRAMVNAARKYKRVFQTGSMQRSWPEFRQAVELVRNGYIGDVSSVVVNIGPPVQEFDLPEQPLPAGLDWNAWLGPNEVQRPYH